MTATAPSAYIPAIAINPSDAIAQKQRPGFVYLGETKQGLFETISGAIGSTGWVLPKYKRIVAVGTGARAINWDADFPSRLGERLFRVRISIRIAPVDPRMLFNSVDYDFANDIQAEVDDELRKITRRHLPTDEAPAEEEMRKWAFHRLLMAGAFQIVFGGFFARMDAPLADRRRRADDQAADGEEQMRRLERRTKLAEVVFAVLPDIPSRRAVAFDLANDPDRIAQYIERIEQQYGEQQRLMLGKLERLAEIVRGGNVDSLDVPRLIETVVKSGNVGAIEPPTPRIALPPSKG